MVYIYFQIPLMVIVFTPALEGLRPQWREAAVNLGATTLQYWRQVGIPLLSPAFLGSMLLLFANAFAAYATAAVLVSQGNPIMPLLIRASLTSEILLGQENLAFALAAEMIVVVSIVMACTRCCCGGRRGGCDDLRTPVPGRPGRRCSAVRALLLPAPLSMLDFSTRGKGELAGRTFEYYGAWSATRTCARRSSPRCCWPC